MAFVLFVYIPGCSWPGIFIWRVLLYVIHLLNIGPAMPVSGRSLGRLSARCFVTLKTNPYT